MNELDLERSIARFLCQMNRMTRDMPSEAEVDRARPYARSLIVQVRAATPPKTKEPK